MKIENRLSEFIRGLCVQLSKRSFLPATQLIVASIFVVGLIHGTWYDRLPTIIRSMFGHSAEHTTSGHWHRIFTSLPLTGDPSHLFAAIVMSLICIGWLEFQRGPLVAVIVFFTSHVATTFLASMLLTQWINWFEEPSIHWMTNANDIGPSAGYYGCLGCALVSLSRYRFWQFGLGLFTWLTIRLMVSILYCERDSTNVQSDLAHLIALVVGILIGIGLIRWHDATKLL